MIVFVIDIDREEELSDILFIELEDDIEDDIDLIELEVEDVNDRVDNARLDDNKGVKVLVGLEIELEEEEEEEDEEEEEGDDKYCTSMSLWPEHSNSENTSQRFKP